MQGGKQRTKPQFYYQFIFDMQVIYKRDVCTAPHLSNDIFCSTCSIYSNVHYLMLSVVIIRRFLVVVVRIVVISFEEYIIHNPMVFGM